MYEYAVGNEQDERIYYYRPSEQSLMNIDWREKFNVISCGYILTAIFYLQMQSICPKSWSAASMSDRYNPYFFLKVYIKD